MKENYKQTSKSNITKMLRYAAAALSAVSFYTTLNGINGIVTNSVWLAGLISFGVQSIILVIGLWFIPALSTIWKQRIRTWLRIIVILFMIALYICAAVFSSFFSYVYMSNAAYADVRLTDYNMELELFLVDNTRTLRNYNDAIYDVALENIRQTAPKFRTLMESYRKTASDEIKQIVRHIPKYKTDTIPTEMRFSADEAITAYEGVNRRSADERLRQDCQRLERDVNQYITYYEKQYYPMYSQYYDDLKNQTDTVPFEARKAEINNLINTMNDQIKLVGKSGHVYGSIRAYVESKCNGIISQYRFLISALKDLENGYDEIQKRPNVIQGEGLTLQNFYEVVYSADISTKEKLDKARSDLQQVVSAYIQNSDEIDAENVSTLVKCIEWLDKLNQCKEVRDRIEQFETNTLKKTYIVVPDRLENGEIDISTSTEETGQVKESVWNAARHTDVAEFISLVKSLPDINQIIRPDANSDNPAIITLRRMEKENYVSSILMEAYKYSRAKLESISDMERAWNYLRSDNNFLAFFCCLIAIFLDIAAFLIGIYMYTCQDVSGKETKKEASATGPLKTGQAISAAGQSR